MHVPPPTTEISPTDFFEFSNTNTSCYVCGISNPGFGSKKCSVTYGGDLMETKYLIEASNEILKTSNTFNGCLTIYTNGGNLLVILYELGLCEFIGDLCQNSKTFMSFVKYMQDS